MLETSNHPPDVKDKALYEKKHIGTQLFWTPRGHAVSTSYDPGVRIKRKVRKDVSDGCFIDIKTKIDICTKNCCLIFKLLLKGAVTRQPPLGG